MKIYTRTGDLGETGLFGGPRVFKDDVRIEAYGTIDELNAALGVARSTDPPAEIDQTLAELQNELFTVGAELATPNAHEKGVPLVTVAHVERLEKVIDDYEAKLPMLKNFILPAGTPAAAALHLARGISRRAERRLVSFARALPEEVTPEMLAYVNRLTDLLFVLARSANHIAGVADVPWEKS
jgi:cob(I)alamin adenosyltransferase